MTAAVGETDPRRTLPLIVAITGMGVLALTLIAPALPDLSDAMGVSRANIGWIQGAVGIPGIFVAPLIGYVYDRRGRRQVAIVSLLVFGIAGSAGFLARSFWPLVIARAIQGVGTAGILALGVILIGDLFPAGAERRRALGFNGAGLTVTGMIAPLVGGSLATVDPFLPFLVFSLAIPLAVWARRLPGLPATGEDRPSPPLRHLAGAARDLRRRGKVADFIGMLPFLVFVMFVFSGLGLTTVPLYLEAEFGAGSATRGLIQSFLSLGSTVGSLSTARLAERSSPGRVFTGGIGLTATAFLVLAGAPALGVVAIGLVVMGLGVGLTFPLLQDFVTSAASDEYRGAVVGGFIGALRFSQSFGPAAGSALAEDPGGRMTFLASAIATVILLVTWRPVRRVARQMERRRPPKPAI